PSTLPSLSFGDFLKKLRTRGLEEKADSYLAAVSEENQLRQGNQDPLTLPLKRAIWLLENPVMEELNRLTQNLKFRLNRFIGRPGQWDNEYVGSYLREQESLG
ncbi:hypothetical protein LCGC14_2616800, partial [marine sediment metagenome]